MTCLNTDALCAAGSAWRGNPDVYARIRARRAAVMMLIGDEPVTAAKIARSMHCSVRSVYRDIEGLRRDGAPIGGAAGLGYVRTAQPRRRAISSHPSEAQP